MHVIQLERFFFVLIFFFLFFLLNAFILIYWSVCSDSSPPSRADSPLPNQPEDFKEKPTKVR